MVIGVVIVVCLIVDIILYNGNIIILNDVQLQVSVLVIFGLWIVVIGDDMVINEWCGNYICIIDLQGKIVIFGLIDIYIYVICGG